MFDTFDVIIKFCTRERGILLFWKDQKRAEGNGQWGKKTDESKERKNSSHNRMLRSLSWPGWSRSTIVSSTSIGRGACEKKKKTIFLGIAEKTQNMFNWWPKRENKLSWGRRGEENANKSKTKEDKTTKKSIAKSSVEAEEMTKTTMTTTSAAAVKKGRSIQKHRQAFKWRRGKY